MRRKKINAYLDGKMLVEVIQASLDNNMTVAELKKKIREENLGRKVEFKIE